LEDVYFLREVSFTTIYCGIMNQDQLFKMKGINKQMIKKIIITLIGLALIIFGALGLYSQFVNSTLGTLFMTVLNCSMALLGLFLLLKVWRSKTTQ